MENMVFLGNQTTSLSDLELRIKEVAGELKIKMKDIAEGVEINNNYLSRINSGKVTPNVKMLQKIADYLKVPVHRIIVSPKGYRHFYDENGNWLGIREQ